MKEDKEYILINKMYTGDFTENNIGHEIINFYKDDDGKSYIYITPYGTIGSDYKKNENDNIETNIKYVLFTTPIFNGNMIEIIGKAEGLTLINNYKNKKEDEKNSEKNKKQRDYIDENNIKYGEKKLYNIFYDNEGNNDAAYITFKAEKVYKIKEDKKLLINMKLKKGMEEVEIDKSKYDEIVNVKWFVGHEKTYKLYEGKLKEIIDNKNYWKEVDTQLSKEDVKSYKDEKNKMLEFILKEDDETIFTNMFFNYFKKNKEELKEFLIYLGIDNINNSDSNELFIEREKSTKDKIDDFNKFVEESKNIDDDDKRIIRDLKAKFIDLWIENKNNIIIVENKIKSGLNGIKKEEELSQLDIYYIYAKLINDKKQIKAFIFVPNYNRKNIEQEIKRLTNKRKNQGRNTYGEKYTIITYREIYEFFKKKETERKGDFYFENLFSSLSKHIYEADKEMERRFCIAINKAKEE